MTHLVPRNFRINSLRGYQEESRDKSAFFLVRELHDASLSRSLSRPELNSLFGFQVGEKGITLSGGQKVSQFHSSFHRFSTDF